jgi:nitroreductase / dihydropteridine reductase
MGLIKDLNWRYATKNMNGKKVSEKKLNIILDAISLAPTSYGLQPFKVLVVKSKSLKAKLGVAAYNQPQVAGSSHVLVFAVPTLITEADVVSYISNISSTRGVPVDKLEGFKNMMLGTVNGLTPELQQIWAAKQAYIALGFAMAAAAEQKIDACPMEGFNSNDFDKILGLAKKGLKSVVILPIGFRHEDDKTANVLKVRRPKEQIFEII